MEIADAMDSLPERIMEYGEVRPEATPIQAGDLLHLGTRALARLARSERLPRICQGVYMRPTPTRCGLRAPSLEQAVTTLASFWGETIVSNGGDAASWLGLKTRNAACTVYFTSGPDRLPQLRGAPGKSAPCYALAACGRTWNCRHRHPVDLMTRSPRGRGGSFCRAAGALARLVFACSTGQLDAFSGRQKE